MFSATGMTEADLRQRGRKVVRRAGKQILLVAAEGRVFATANRCPHEGYPLSEGTLGPNCVLTCNWHNWKFDLVSGEALVGRDPVRRYPVELRGGEIFVDLSDPPAEAQRERALKGLDAALSDNDLARMARELARLERAGFEAAEGLVHAIAAVSDRLEGGMTHAHAAAADWLALAERAPSAEARLAAILEPISHLAEDTLGAGRFPYAEGRAPWEPNAFLAAIEAEDEPRAIALVRGALAERIPYERLRPAFAAAALSHYADFGHCAIYTLKAGQLIARLGEEAAEPVLAKDFVGLSIDGALKRVLASSDRALRELYDAPLGAAAFNLLHFDLAFERATDNAIADNIGWLDFTHALTFANACRHLCEESPELRPRALLQLALFVGRNRKYVDPEEDMAPWRVADRGDFLKTNMASLYDHGTPEPIIACHRLKVLFALEDELRAAPDAPWAEEMCAAVNRYLSTPMKRRQGLRTASQALDFIAREG